MIPLNNYYIYIYTHSLNTWCTQLSTSNFSPCKLQYYMYLNYITDIYYTYTDKL